MNNNILNDKSQDENLTKYFRNLLLMHIKDDEFSGYLQDTADLFTRLRIENHITQCTFCKDELQMLKDLREQSSGEISSELEFKIRKRLSFIPVHPSIRKAEFKEKVGALIHKIGKIPYSTAAIGLMAKASAGWSENQFSKDKNCYWAYKQDSDLNLIISISVRSNSEPKQVKLHTRDQKWLAKFEPCSDGWNAKVLITEKERRKLMNGENIIIEDIEL